MILFLLFVVVPLVEFSLLMRVGALLGFGPTVLLVVVTGVIGARLARRQGLGVLSAMQEEMARGQVPSQEISHGLLILLAGALLVTPGVLTDAVGFFLLVPWTRAMIQPWVVRQVKKRFGKGAWTHVHVGTQGPRTPNNPPPPSPAARGRGEGPSMNRPQGPVLDAEIVDSLED